ncbi:MAG TPA: AI-2E family transporter [Vicinamibacteria bacterium]
MPTAKDAAHEAHGAQTGLFVLACLYTIYFARPVLLPLTLGLILDFLFRPVVRRLKRWRVPEPAGAALVILALVGGFGFGLYTLSGPASEWLAKAPRSLPQVEARLQKVLRPVERVTQTAEQVGKLASPGAPDLPEVKLKEEGLGAMLFGGTQTFLEAAIVTLTLLFFLLASGDLFLRRVIALVAGPQERSRAGEIAREIEKHVSRYLYASTGINVAFGVVTALAMHLLGLPNALLWGVVAGLTAFIPYLGGLIAAALIGMAALLTFTDTSPVVTIILVFLLLDTLKGYILYPLVMGRQFTMNAAMLFMALTFWWWAWGIPGALLAVPLMAILKIFSERMDGLTPLAKLLEEQ